MENTNLSDLMKQCEFYMSDENLKHDPFFHNKITASENGFIPVEILLNCNKIKKLTNKLENVVEAISKSSKLELDSNKKLFKRKSNELPKLEILNREVQVKKLETKPVSYTPSSNEIVIFNIKTSKCIDVKWKEIQEKIINSNPNIVISYLRFSLDSGHLGIAECNLKDLVNMSIKLDENGGNIEISKCSGDDLLNFWKQHGEHLKMCMNKQSKFDKDKKKTDKYEKKVENDKRENKNTSKLRKPVTLGGVKFLDVKDIRQKARSILNNITPGEKLLAHDENFVKDILKFHPNKEKSKDLSHFTVGTNSNFNDSKCFIIVNKDNSQSDFSINKCIEVIISTYN